MSEDDDSRYVLTVAQPVYLTPNIDHYWLPASVPRRTPNRRLNQRQRRRDARRRWAHGWKGGRP